MTLIQNVAATRHVRDHKASHASSARLIADPVSIINNLVTKEYDNFEMRLDASTAALWCYMRPPGNPIVTHDLLGELAGIQRGLQQAFPKTDHHDEAPIAFFAFASRTPGVFNLGGDLAHFAECVRRRDRATIHQYARTCVEIVYENTNAFHTPMVTMAVVQGDALGGGFETALSFDMIVAERSAKFCLPEILFNLFPGMGALTFLSRKIGAARAQQLITSGDMLTAEQLYEMGLIDILAEDGEGEWAATEYMRKNRKRHSGLYAINQARRLVNPVTLEELQRVVDVWTDAVFRLNESNLRTMEKLASAQARRTARAKVID